jgi:2-hydroxymuconate-semialdehyde hydrolase
MISVMPDPIVPRTTRVRISDRSLHVREWGDRAAEPVLLIHGIPTNGLLWRDVAPRLARRTRVIAPDLLGYGESDSPAGEPVDIEAQAGHLLDLMDALHVSSATVVGHDIGGGIAQILAVRHPRSVARLGLVNSVCYDSWPIPGMKALKATAPVVERMPAGLTLEGVKLSLRRGFVDKEKAELFLDLFLDPFATADGLRLFVEQARSLDPTPTIRLAPLLPELKMPVGIVWGRQDPFQKPEYAERLAGDIPTSELTWVEDASHFAPVDAPDAVAEALERLLGRPT